MPTIFFDHLLLLCVVFLCQVCKVQVFFLIGKRSSKYTYFFPYWETLKLLLTKILLFATHEQTGMSLPEVGGVA